MLITVHPIQPAPRPSFLARMRELWLVPFMHLEGGCDMGIPHHSHPCITVGLPVRILAGEPVMLCFDKIEVPAQDGECQVRGN